MQVGRRVLDSLFAFVGVLTADGTLTEANRSPLRAEVFGRKLWDYYWFNHAASVQDLVRDVVARAGGGEAARTDIVVRLEAGRFATIHLMIAPLLNDRGAVTHLVASAVDVTERKQAEDALRASQERLALAVDAACMGLYERDAATGVTLDARARSILGLAAAAGTSETDHGTPWLASLHPDDAGWITDLDRQLADGRVDRVSAEYRYRHPARGWVWLSQVARVIARGPDGRRRRELGLLQDVTSRKRAEEVLARQAAILEATPDFVATAAADGQIVYMNRTLAQIVGATDPTAFHLWKLTQLHPPWAARVFVDEGLPTAVRDGSWAGETAIQTADGREIPTSQAVIAHRDRFGGLLYLSTILRDLSPSRELERETNRAVVEEQQRIGQELHDGVGQELTGLALMADMLQKRLRTISPPDATLATTMSTGLERVREDIRGLSRGLVPVEVDPEGLRSALQDLAASTGERSGVACSFRCIGRGVIADTTVATHLFRIAQESVGNALRHSRASAIEILLEEHGAQITLTVRDNGSGLPSDHARRGGLGLRIMQHRAGLVGGGVQLIQVPGGGTAVACTIPRRTAHD